MDDKVWFKIEKRCQHPLNKGIGAVSKEIISSVLVCGGDVSSHQQNDILHSLPEHQLTLVS